MKNGEKPSNPTDLLSEEDLFEGLKSTPYTEGWPEDKWREVKTYYLLFILL